MDADEVGRGEQRLERRELDARHVAPGTRPGDDAHPEPLGAPGHRLPDRPESDETERGAVDVAAEQHIGFPDALGSPCASAHEAVALGNASGRGEQQREGEVGRGFGEDARRVADRDAPRGRRVEIDVIDPHRNARHDAEARTALEERGIDAIGEQAEQSVAVARECGECLRRRRLTVRPHMEIEAAGQISECSTRQCARRDDPRSVVHSAPRFIGAVSCSAPTGPAFRRQELDLGLPFEIRFARVADPPQLVVVSPRTHAAIAGHDRMRAGLRSSVHPPRRQAAVGTHERPACR